MMATYFGLLLQHIQPFLCVILAAYLQSVTGFGLAIITAPLLMFFYDSKTVVTLVLLLACSGNLAQCLFYFRKAYLKLVLWLYLGVLLGEGPGFLIYDTVSSTALKLIVDGSIILSMLLIQWTHHTFRETTAHTVTTGFFAGIASVTTGMGGPPLMMYLANTRLDPDRLRASYFIFFFISNFTSLLVELAGGYDVCASLTDFFYLLPALVIGLIIGNLTYSYISQQRIRQIIWILLYGASLSGIIQTLWP
ncbi:sulfite exporter TauE/SafE family protein [Megasphaera sp. WILCCON 0056]|uniref:sulfite exporter TauE/SafE family protein n=1 Tax=Megasphaera sp. WILCCON 0056 TaxID=3345340 RepID=UPI003A8041F1